MADTNRLGLPFLAAAQAQKHVTVNDALRLLDGIVQARVLNATTSSPPASPVNGVCYIVANSATGDWSGWDDDIAMWADGAWYRIPRFNGMRVWDATAQDLLVYSGSWQSLAVVMGFLAQAPSVNVAVGANNSAVGMQVIEETLSGLSGPTVTSSITIPNRSICLGVSTRTTAAITGATSYDCGTVGEVAKFGGTLGVAAGSTNKGVIGPQAFYGPTPIVLTANGSDFTGGTVRIAIHLLTVGLPS